MRDLSQDNEIQNPKEFIIPYSKHNVCDKEIRQIACYYTPGWLHLNPQTITVTEITGGISNNLLKCTNSLNQHVLVRIYGKNTEYVIDRAKELKVIMEVSQLGLGPQLYGTFKNGYVYSFTSGCALSVEVVRHHVKDVATTLAKWHKMKINSDTPKSQLFPTLKRWLGNVMSFEFEPAKAEKVKTVDLHRIGREIDELEHILSKSPIVFCHNDLLSGNIIYNKETRKTHFIDFEYSAYNYQAYDIGNHFIEWTGFELEFSKYPTREEQYEFLTIYLNQFNGCAPTKEEVGDLYVLVNQFALLTHINWGLWSFHQAKYSEIDFDFADYGAKRLNLYLEQKADFLKAQPLQTVL